jgi:hypothetical protein
MVNEIVQVRYSVLNDSSGHSHHTLSEQLNQILGIVDAKVRNLRH